MAKPKKNPLDEVIDLTPKGENQEPPVEAKNKKKADAKAKPLKVVTAQPQSITKDEAEALFNTVKSETKNLKASFLSVAKALYEIHERGAYRLIGFGSFNDYVEKDCDLGVRSAYHLVDVYKKFGVDMKTDRPDALEVIGEVGWTKAKELTGVVNAENLDSWVDKAKSSSTPELIKQVKASLPPKEKKEKETEFVDRKFKLAEEQAEVVDLAIEIASGISQSDKAGHNLALIATSFIETANPEKFAEKGCANLEQLLGLRIIAINPIEGVVVHGQNYLDELTAK